MLLSACGSAMPAKTSEPKAEFQWIHDDYPAALAAARAENKPLFIDMWAPWCHTCLSMKHYVFNDPGLSHHANRMIWLALDTDKEVNAEAVKKFPPGPWPKFYVINPKDESVLATHDGSASVKQLRELFDLNPSKQTLAVQKIAHLVKAKSPEAYNYIEPGMREAAIDHTASTCDFASYAQEVATSKIDLRFLAANVRLTVDDNAAPLSIDDRSDCLRILRELHERLGEKREATLLAERQFDLLIKTVAAAPDASIAMTYNWPLAEVAVYLNRGSEIVPVLQKSVDALPNEYDPPYRLAWVYSKLGQKDKAKPLADLALERSYGARKKRIQEFRNGLDAR
jgi:thiol-disulfide isomerase/thioredoxin